MWVVWHILCSCGVIYIRHLTRLPQTSVALKATIPTPLQQLKHQIFQTANATTLIRPNCVDADTSTPKHPVSDWQWTLYLDPLEKLSSCSCKCQKKKKKANCAFWAANKVPFSARMCTTLGKTQCPLTCGVEKSFESCRIPSNLLQP